MVRHETRKENGSQNVQGLDCLTRESLDIIWKTMRETFKDFKQKKLRD